MYITPNQTFEGRGSSVFTVSRGCGSFEVLAKADLSVEGFELWGLYDELAHCIEGDERLVQLARKPIADFFRDRTRLIYSLGFFGVCPQYGEDETHDAGGHKDQKALKIL